jgi:hypothetical protein
MFASNGTAGVKLAVSVRPKAKGRQFLDGPSMLLGVYDPSGKLKETKSTEAIGP